ncbi:MAG: hypothetical protein R3B91_06025 [Planctomycetaceae bacterium]
MVQSQSLSTEVHDMRQLLPAACVRGAFHFPIVQCDRSRPQADHNGRASAIRCCDREADGGTHLCGSALNEEDTQALKAAMAETDERKSVTAIQEVLDPYCLAVVKINAESRVSAVEGPVAKELVQQGWRTFLIKVDNEAGDHTPAESVEPSIGCQL